MNTNDVYFMELEQAKKRNEYNAAQFHAHYSRRCAHCGKFFVGGDWRFAETIFCSQECELSATPKKALNPYRRHEIKMFWRDFGRDIRPYEEAIQSC